MKPYRVYSNAVITTNAAAYAQISQNGRISAIHIATAGVAGAATTGHLSYELSLNTGAGTILVNDTPGTSLVVHSQSFPVNAGAASGGILIAGLNIMVQGGDRLYLHTYLSGQQPASAICHVTIYVA